MKKNWRKFQILLFTNGTLLGVLHEQRIRCKDYEEISDASNNQCESMQGKQCEKL